MSTFIFLVLTGLFGGIVSGLFGVGGGLIFVPLLILFKKYDPHLAVGTSLAIIIPTAFMGFYKHLRAGMVDWKGVVLITVFAIIGAWIGSSVSLQLEGPVLKRCLAVFLLLLSLKMFFSK